MLEAIADFWKPAKRGQASPKLRSEDVQIGSSLMFGSVAQPSLSGRRFSVTAINTYKFGPDILTSFVLSQEKDAGASLIIADNGTESYLALSRRIGIADRKTMFNMEDIDAVLHFAEAKTIASKEIPHEYKGWIAPYYKRELQSIRGHLYKGDHRHGLLTGQVSSDFMYSLLVSDNSEFALEIEEYDDGRTEIYTTVYRRMHEVTDVTHPNTAPENLRPEVKLVSNSATTVIEPLGKPAPSLGKGTPLLPPDKTLVIERATESKEPVVPPAAPVMVSVQQDVVASAITLPEFSSESVAQTKEILEAAFEPPPPPSAPRDHKPIETPAPHILTPAAELPEPIEPPAAIVQQRTTQPFIQQEIKAVSKELNNFVNESIDCELQVANKIIDEAIRNEMRINDVVRRVIGLPVSQQESVQIPITLTDQDYALLAIRYGIPAQDRDAIKQRIIEDLGDFSGAHRNKRAA